MTKNIILNENGLTIEDVCNIVRNGYQLDLSETVKKKVQLARKAIENAVESGQKIYGITTGFGALRDIVIEEKDAAELQTNLIRSHAVAVGEPTKDEYVKAMMVLRVAALARGNSGCQLKTLENLIAMINNDVLPIIPLKGSVGASGDLAQLSHMALAMIGEGKRNLKYKGQIYDARDGLEKAGIPRTKLSYKEGLALNNGVQFSTGIACMALREAYDLVENGILATALTCEALKAAKQQFDERIHLARNHPGQIKVAKKLREYNKGSKFVKLYGNVYTCPGEFCGYYYDPELGDQSQGIKEWTLFEDLPEDWICPNCGIEKNKFEKQLPKLQDDYSIRCSPQVIGPIIEVLENIQAVLSREINAATDNPLIFIKKEKPLEYDIYSGGNFHGEPIAIAMDNMAVAMAELGSISERRSAKMIDSSRNEGLGAFLIHFDALGLNSGYMMPQYVAAALVSENKILASPASVDSIPTSANAEDHVSMSPLAARKVASINENLVYIIAIEMMLAAQGIDLRCETQKLNPKEALGEKTYKAYKFIRSIVPKLTYDRIIYPDIEKIVKSILDKSVLRSIE
ncbi:MAG TPA: aromatic amino acid lyase [candidate division Zixibacteria bacterium]|nr:aromatic amino acid lyase [candidate division Zixibacteria bacterium]